MCVSARWVGQPTAWFNILVGQRLPRRLSFRLCTPAICMRVHAVQLHWFFSMQLHGRGLPATGRRRRASAPPTSRRISRRPALQVLEEGRSHASTLIGTPYYLSPELAQVGGPRSFPAPGWGSARTSHACDAVRARASAPGARNRQSAAHQVPTAEPPCRRSAGPPTHVPAGAALRPPQ